MSDITLRKLEISELDDFCQLREEATTLHPESFGYLLHEAREEALSCMKNEKGGSAVFGAFDGENLVGIACVSRKTGKRSHKAEIWSLYVREGSRAQGVGRKLVEHCLSFLENEPGVEQVILNCAVNNPAVAMYRKLGFEEYGRDVKCLKIDDEYFDEYLMVKFF